MGYDLVIVGGGIAGASLAKGIAERGARVLLLEREQRFRDRVGGEGMRPWGVNEAQALGLYNTLKETCAHEARWEMGYRGSTLLTRRDLIENTRHRAGELDFYHPAMQEVLLGVAAATGAEVRRGRRVPASLPESRQRSLCKLQCVAHHRVQDD